MFCNKCGKEIPNDSKFCPECASKAVEVQAEVWDDTAEAISNTDNAMVTPKENELHTELATKRRRNKFFLCVGIFLGFVAIVLVFLSVYYKHKSLDIIASLKEKSTVTSSSYWDDPITETNANSAIETTTGAMTTNKSNANLQNNKATANTPNANATVKEPN